MKKVAINEIVNLEIEQSTTKYYIHESISNTGIGSIFMQKGEKYVYFQ